MSKAAKSEVPTDEWVPLFQSIGLSQAKAQEAAKSPKNAAALKNIIENHPVLSQNGLDEKQAGLIVTLAGTLAKSSGVVRHGETEVIISNILHGKLKTVDQISGNIRIPTRELINSCVLLAAVKYMETHHVPIDEADFDKHCGIGAYSIIELQNLPYIRLQVSPLPLPNYLHRLTNTSRRT
jgi:glutaminyl-tRNA synthetase